MPEDNVVTMDLDPSMIKRALNSKTTFTMNQAVAMIMADFQSSATLQPWERFDVTKCWLMLGPHGCGKSASLKAAAQRAGWDWTIHSVGSTALEDDLGVPFEKDGRAIYAAPDWFPVDPPDSEEKKGICILDELVTANREKQNLVREILSEYKAGNLHIHPGWFLAGTGNPPDRQMYSTVQILDVAIDDRLNVLVVNPDFDDFMRYVADNEVLPESLRLFLRMDDQSRREKGAWHELTSRHWVIVGDTLLRMGDDISMDMKKMLLQTKLSGKTVDRYYKFLRDGADSDAWPIPGQDILDPAQLEENLRKLEKWKSAGNNDLLFCTGYELQTTITSAGLKMNKAEIEAVAKCSAFIHSDILVGIAQKLDKINASLQKRLAVEMVKENPELKQHSKAISDALTRRYSKLSKKRVK